MDDIETGPVRTPSQDRRRKSLPAFHFYSPKEPEEAIRRPISFALECAHSDDASEGDGNGRTQSAVREALTVLDDTKQVQWSQLKVRERWRRAGNLVRATVLLKKRFPWFQLSGHGAEFQQHQSPEWVLKKVNKNELAAFQALEGDPLTEFTAVCAGVVQKADNDFLQLQNLLFGLSKPYAAITTPPESLLPFDHDGKWLVHCTLTWVPFLLAAREWT